MALYKDEKRGSWYFRIRVLQMNGTSKEVTRRGFKTKSSARDAEANYIVSNGRTDNKSTTTFREVALHFIDEIKPSISGGTYDQYTGDIERYLLPYFDKHPIAKITARDISDWKRHHLKLNYAKSTYDRHFARLSSIFNHGMKYFDVLQNPCKIAGGFRIKDNPRDWDYWTFEEFNDFIGYVTDFKYYTFFTLEYYCGMRRGEIQALQWKDFYDNIIDINKAVCYNKKDGDHIGPTKTPQSVRKVSIISHAVQSLEKLKKHYEDTVRGFNDDFYIFGSVNFLPRTTIYNKFHNYCIKNGIRKIKFHELRHSHATYIISNGASPVLVASRLGHKDVKETLNTYAHFYPREQDSLIDKIEENISCGHDVVTEFKG